MKILMATSEFSPLSSTGELGEQVRTLALELKQLGHDVSIVTPLYRSVRESHVEITSSGIQFQVSLGDKRVSASLAESKTPDGISVYLVRRDEYFDRSGIYTSEGHGYEDNSERFIFFSKAVVEVARRISPIPDVIHCHDWQTALVPVLIRDRQMAFQTVLTIHNLEHQGSFWNFDFAMTGLPGTYFSPKGVEFYGRLNLLKGGILFADAVTLPGEVFLNESLTPENSFGLNLVLEENSGRTIGILPGVDYSVTNPAAEKLWPKKSKTDGGDWKAASRQVVATQTNLQVESKELLVTLPLDGIHDPALTTVVPVLDRLLSSRFRMILSGPVADEFLPSILVAVRKYPGRFSWNQSADSKLQSLFLAGSDFVLLPGSLGWRCQTVISALRYGTVPIARNRVGLRQIIVDFDPIRKQGNGLVYYDDSGEAVCDVFKRAIWTYENPEFWKALRSQAETSDFSWAESARAFARVYAGLLRHRHAMPA